ncbi:MAG: hypothetical protein IBX40_07610 [Methanosarcinales archaeon]|nr:hypothetical protein [Methanosarcinales archaeon]
MKHKTRKFLYLICIIIILSFGFGCLGNSSPEPHDFPSGELGTYEINTSTINVTNSTTFFLFSNKTVRAVSTFVNSSSLKINIPKDASAEFGSGKDPVIKDLVVMGNISINNSNNFEDNNFTRIPYSSSFLKSGNSRIVILEFEELSTGFAAYSFSREYGYFFHILSRNETITVVLPAGHNTSNIILGSPKPIKPDEKFKDSKNRMWLVWFDPYPDKNFISVKYYKEYLPRILSIVGTVLLIGFIVSALYYNRKIRKLQKEREDMEQDVRKKE